MFRTFLYEGLSEGSRPVAGAHQVCAVPDVTTSLGVSPIWLLG